MEKGIAESKKLLEWCKEHFDFEAQKWDYDNIPDEILDCAMVIAECGYPKLENGHDNDFIIDFIYDEILDSKYGKITKALLKGEFLDEIKNLVENLFN